MRVKKDTVLDKNINDILEDLEIKGFIRVSIADKETMIKRYYLNFFINFTLTNLPVILSILLSAYGAGKIIFLRPLWVKAIGILSYIFFSFRLLSINNGLYREIKQSLVFKLVSPYLKKKIIF